jgi:two-component system, cell cycle response regulator
VDYEERHIPFGILLIEIEGLRRLDELYGRSAEHEIITELTDTLARCMRHDDHLGWWSENRLLAITANCWPLAVAEIAETLQDLVSQTTVSWWGDRVAAKVKVSRADVQDDDSAESLVTRCEEAFEV